MLVLFFMFTMENPHYLLHLLLFFSSFLANSSAAPFPFKYSSKKAKPVLLEPLMNVPVETPAEYTGDVICDLSRRRGVIPGQQ